VQTDNQFDIALATEIAKFYDDPLGFVMFAFPWGEDGPLKNYDGPDKWQRNLLIELGNEISQRKFDGINAVAPIRFSIASGHGIGKSCLTAFLILFIMSTRPNAKGVVTSGKYEQLKDKTWSELSKWHKLAINSHWFEYRGTRGNLCFFNKLAPSQWTCNGQAAQKENADSFAGLHNANSTPFYIFDEASAIDDKIYEVAEGGLTDGEPMIFLFGNPTQNTGKFRETFGSQKHRWIHKQIDSRNAKMTNKELINQWIEDYGEDSDFVRVRVKGQFPRSGNQQFIASDVVDRAVERTIEVPVGTPKLMSLDVARFGGDYSVIARRHGRKLEELIKFRELDTMQLAAETAVMIKKYQPDAVFVDGVGVGGGVVDRLRLLGFSVIDVNAGAATDTENKDKYRNKRAEMWGRMRQWLEDADIPRDTDLINDLIGIEYGYDDRMRIQLEKKEDMKKRGLSSPDCADALALTFAYALPPVDIYSESDLEPEYYDY